MNGNQLKDTNYLTISRGQSSWVAVGCLITLCLTFVWGYFLGTKHATEEFVAHVQQETFADHVFASVHSLSHTNVVQAPVVEQKIEQKEANESEQEPVVVVTDSVRYAAELIGFGTQKAAQTFIDRVAKNSGISLELRTRQSTSARGKKITWYQVVTTHYDNREELNTALQAITKKETLRDINIVAC